MPKLPTGTLTVLHTEIESSTLLTLRLGARYPEALALHRDLIRTAFAQHDGYEVDTQGDSFFAVFSRATQAAAAAVAIQRALTKATWPAGGTIRVRVGLHTGEPIRTAEGYTGIDVIRGTRVRDAGYGGQILLSGATAVLLDYTLPDEMRLRDCGEYRLKGLPKPEQIFQLIVPDLQTEFPPLKSLDSPQPNQAPGTAGRVLTTLLYVDMDNSSGLIVTHGDRGWQALRTQFITLIRQLLAKHNGEEMEAIADQVLAVFSSAAAAIRCGCAITEAVKALGITTRASIHAGEVDFDHLSGITTLTSVHIAMAGQPGDLLVSQTVKELVAGSDIQFIAQGTHTFKGLLGEWELYKPVIDGDE